MVLIRRAFALLGLLMAASVSLTSEAGAVAGFGAAASPSSFTQECAAMGTIRGWLGIPTDEQAYAPCLEGSSRIRLRGPHGLKLEPAGAHVTDTGISYVMPAGAVGAPDSIGLLAWRDVRGVDVWSSQPSNASTTNLCATAGYVVGLVIANALTPESETLRGGLGRVLLVGVEAIPLGVVGLAIGKHFDHEQPGHWVPCESSQPSELPRLTPRTTVAR